MAIIWLTGLSGAGKTTLGNSVFNKLKKFKKELEEEILPGLKKILSGRHLKRLIQAKQGSALI